MQKSWNSHKAESRLMRFLILPTSGWARNTTRTTLHHHSQPWLCSSHTPSRDQPPKPPPGSAGCGTAARRPAQTASAFSFQPRVSSREIFLVEKSSDSFCGSQELFWAGACASAGALPCRCCPGASSSKRRDAAPSASRSSWITEPGGCQGCCAIPLFTFQLGPYPFRPPAGFVVQRKLLRSPDKQTGNRVFHCADTLSARG